VCGGNGKLFGYLFVSSQCSRSQFRVGLWSRHACMRNALASSICRMLFVHVLLYLKAEGPLKLAGHRRRTWSRAEPAPIGPSRNIDVHDRQLHL